MSQAARLQARQRYFNVVVTNVPGPQVPLYLLGRELLAIYPVVPLARNQALGIAIMSYNGRLGLRAARRLRRAAGPRRRRRARCATRSRRCARRRGTAEASPPHAGGRAEAEAGRAERAPAGMNGAIALVTGADNPQGIGRAVCHALAARGAVVACSVAPRVDRRRGRPARRPDRGRPGRPGGARGAARRGRGVRRPPVDPRQQRRALHARRLRRPRRRDARRPLGRQRPRTRAAELRARPRPPARDAGPHREPRSSGQFLGPMPGELAYTASKGALQAFTVQLAAEVAPLGITVNAVGPGPNDTGWIDDDLRAELLPTLPDGPHRPAGGRGGARGVPVLRGGGLGDRPGRARRGRVPPRVSATGGSMSPSSAPGSSASRRPTRCVRRGASVVCLDGGAPGHGAVGRRRARLPPSPRGPGAHAPRRALPGGLAAAGGARRGRAARARRDGPPRRPTSSPRSPPCARSASRRACSTPTRRGRGCRGSHPRPDRCCSTPAPARSAPARRSRR